MDTSITFQIDADVKQQMSDICKELGITTSAAFNLFANAFVHAKGMPFPLTDQYQQMSFLPAAKMSKDADDILKEFADDYARMAE